MSWTLGFLTEAQQVKKSDVRDVKLEFNNCREEGTKAVHRKEIHFTALS